MINWKDARKEQPLDGQVIWYVTKYRTGEIPQAFDISGGTFEISPCGSSRRVLGRNWSCCYWPGDSCADNIVAWCDLSEINVPDFGLEGK